MQQSQQMIPPLVMAPDSRPMPAYSEHPTPLPGSNQMQGMHVPTLMQTVENRPISSYSEQSASAANPNQIQNLVCNLIRQNNMKKPYDLPPWVDVTKPPPPLPHLLSQSPMPFNSPPNQPRDQFDNISSMQAINTQQLHYPNMQQFASPQALNSPAPANLPSEPPCHYAGGDSVSSFIGNVKPATVFPQHHQYEDQAFSNQADLGNVMPHTQRYSQEQHQRPSFQNPLLNDHEVLSSALPRRPSFENENINKSEVERKSSFEMHPSRDMLPQLASAQRVLQQSIEIEQKVAVPKPSCPDLIENETAGVHKDSTRESKPSFEMENKFGPQGDAPAQLHKQVCELIC